ncbi:MAG: hypothetical protein M0R03_00490 [Novosphingobium sp.]|jgi:hypothetical protein|nr:hypothetical protein [Novosphingobium sp.]
MYAAGFVDNLEKKGGSCWKTNFQTFTDPLNSLLSLNSRRTDNSVRRAMEIMSALEYAGDQLSALLWLQCFFATDLLCHAKRNLIDSARDFGRQICVKIAPVVRA